jgi:hypothetical protein
VVLVAAVALLTACGGGKPDATGAADATTTAPASGPQGAVTGPTTPEGLQIGPAPWVPEYAHLQARLDKDGIPALRVEGHVEDVHVYLLIAVHGHPVTVPALIGVNGKEESGQIIGPGFVSPLHTHDATGLIHIHSPDHRTYRVGEIFDVWGVRFTDTCLGEYCENAPDTIRVFINGKEQHGDLRRIPLANLQIITVLFGSQAETPSSIPDKFPGT